MSELPRLYSDFAEWFHLLTSPEEYAEEASFYARTLMSLCSVRPQSVLELGCGGGNNASHMKGHFSLTLTDVSPDMLNVSRAINPECEHVLGDMRSLRLGRTFDAVFAQDALDYLTTRDDLNRAVETAWVHCKAGGGVLFAPDCVRETFSPAVEHGGHDGPNRALRYLEWSWDRDPSDSEYASEMVYVMRDEGGSVTVVHETHRLGLFSRAEWLDAMAQTGFRADSMPYSLTGVEAGQLEVFLGRKPTS